MRTILSIALLWGLFISGFAQVADNVQEATRYRVNQDNICTLADNHQFQSFAVTQADLNLPEGKSNVQLDELGDFIFLKSAPQLNELGDFIFLKSAPQLNELGDFIFLKSAPQLNELGDFIFLKSAPQLNELGDFIFLKSSTQLDELGDFIFLK
jgi:hypothetical protein